MTDQELIDRHPLRVQFPSLSGEYYLLVWWTHNDQHHVAVARTPEKVEMMFRRMLTSEGRYDGRIDWQEAEPRRFYRVNIVAPSQEMRLRFARAQQEHEVRSFGDWIVSSMRILEDADEPLPSGVKKCPKFKLPADYEGGKPDRWTRDRHYDCINCRETFVFNVEDFYPRMRETWLKERGYHERVEGGESKAPEALPGQKLYEVRDAHGHHSDGTVVGEVLPDQEYFDRIKFFCHAEELPLPEEMVQLRAKMDAQWENTKKRREAEHEANMDRAEKEAVAKLKAIFS